MAYWAFLAFLAF
jgi:hypothetical protein